MKKVFCAVRCALALCLCVMTLCGAACAEGIVELSTGCPAYLSYKGTLPDGRILLAGARYLPETSYDMRAWLVCLNPDRTVSWEFADAADGGHYGSEAAAVLPDGTIGAVFEDRQMGDENRPDRITIRFFTQDGEPTGKEFGISPENVVFKAYPYGLLMYRWKEDEETSETRLTDWNGNEILRYDGLIMPGAYGEIISNTDELAFAGHDTEEHGHAKIMKLDGLTDRILWETTLDWQLPDTKEARIVDAVRTGDGGYAAILQDGNYESPGEFTIWRDFLVKFDAEGRVQWIHRDSFEKDDLYVLWVFAADGKIGVLCEPQSDNIYDGFVSLTVLWFDQDGKQLRTAEWLPDPDDFPVMKQYLEPEGIGNKRLPCISLYEPIAMEDGLWALANCFAVEWEDGEYIGTCEGSQELVLVKIPEA